MSTIERLLHHETPSPEYLIMHLNRDTADMAQRIHYTRTENPQFKMSRQYVTQLHRDFLTCVPKEIAANGSSTRYARERIERAIIAGLLIPDDFLQQTQQITRKELAERAVRLEAHQPFLAVARAGGISNPKLAYMANVGRLLALEEQSDLPLGDMKEYVNDFCIQTRHGFTRGVLPYFYPPKSNT